MREREPFTRDDLEELGDLYARATAVVPMREIAAGGGDAATIAVRHDVDDNAGSLDTALRLAEWEAERGWFSTYFLLHDAHYWPQVGEAARELEQLGHEVGLHLNAIAEGIRQRRDPRAILDEALADLREHVTVTGTVAHGDMLCHAWGFVNDELWLECQRPAYGNPGRYVGGVKIDPVSLADYGLTYDANWLSRGDYLSDSGGQWSQPFDKVAARFPAAGQLHVLVHPDWWAHAFAADEVPA